MFILLHVEAKGREDREVVRSQSGSAVASHPNNTLRPTLRKQDQIKYGKTLSCNIVHWLNCRLMVCDPLLRRHLGPRICHGETLRFTKTPLTNPDSVVRLHVGLSRPKQNSPRIDSSPGLLAPSLALKSNVINFSKFADVRRQTVPKSS